MLKEENT